jgi:peptidoglycan/LPS O-acetylase OafA/YrhL
VILIASFVLGFCSYYALERPFLRLKPGLSGD